MCGRAASLAEEQSFRMPLHPKDRKPVMDDSFDNTIISVLDNPQFPSEPVYGLVVRAVCNHMLPIEFFKE